LIPLALADAWAVPPGPIAVAVAVMVWSEVTGQVAWLPVPEAQPDQLTDVAFVAVAVNVAGHTGWQSPDVVTATVGGQGPVGNADRCACEVKNPQGSCCLGNLAAASKALKVELNAGEEAAPHHA